MSSFSSITTFCRDWPIGLHQWRRSRYAPATGCLDLCRMPTTSPYARRRMLKRRYRRTQNPSDRQQWIEHERHRHQVYMRKAQLYWSVWTCQSAQKTVAVTECVARQEYSENFKPKLSLRTTASRSLHWESGISAQINWRVWSFNCSACYDYSSRPVCRLFGRGYPESHHGCSGEVVCIGPSTYRSSQNVPTRTTSVHHSHVQRVTAIRLLTTESVSRYCGTTSEEGQRRSHRRQELSANIQLDVHV